MPPAPSTARLVVSIILRQGEKVLILHEPDDESGMRFNLPGGHVEAGEGLLEAAVREAREETGLEVVIERLVQLISNSWENASHSVRQTFLGRIQGGELKAEEGSEIVWMTEDEVKAAPNEKWIFGVKEALALAFEESYIPIKNVIYRNKGEVGKLMS